MGRDSPVLAGSNGHSWSAKAQLRHWSNRVVSRNVPTVRLPAPAADQVEQVVHAQGDPQDRNRVWNQRVWIRRQT